MKLGARVLLFLIPIVLAALCKAIIIVCTASAADKLVLFQHPERLVDVSIDLLMTATAVLLGVLLYVQSGTATTTPGGAAITTSDIVICCAVEITALVLVFGLTLAMPQIPYIHDNYEAAATIWIPDLIGLVAFLWVIKELT